MRFPRWLATSAMFGILAAACGKSPLLKFTLDAGGIVATPDALSAPDGPSTPGFCPTGESQCGSGAFATCRDLRADPANCGSCGHACTPGIPCRNGACQQVACRRPVTFTPRDPFAPEPTDTSNSPGWILVDTDADGVLDLVSWSYQHYTPGDPGPFTGSFNIARGTGQGGFGPATALETACWVWNITPVDLNGDGVPDLLIEPAVFPGADTCPALEAFVGRSGGYPEKGQPLYVPSPRIPLDTGDWVSGPGRFLGMGDLNGDGRPDLVTRFLGVGAYKIGISLANPTGGFDPPRDYETDEGVNRVDIRDWNGDGSPDLAFVGETIVSLAMLFNRGDGTFDPVKGCGLAQNFPTPFAIADITQDGRPDLVHFDGSALSVLGGQGGCAFQVLASLDVPMGSRGLTVADLSGDGRLDMVSNVPYGGLDFMYGNPKGSFDLDAYVFPPSFLVGQVAIGDLNRDGKPDILVDKGSGWLQVLENTCSPE